MTNVIAGMMANMRNTTNIMMLTSFVSQDLQGTGFSLGLAGQRPEDVRLRGLGVLGLRIRV